MTNYYTILGLPQDSTIEEIRREYYAQCRKYHPDKVEKSVGKRVLLFEGNHKGIIRETYGELCKVELDAEPGVLKMVRTNELAVELYEDSGRWHLLQRAWHTLSDPCKRLTYHWRSQLIPRTENVLRELLAEIKASHVIDEANMETSYKEISERERKNGLSIIQAWYGDLHVCTDVRPVPLNDATSFRGPVLDVTKGVQCLVDNHKIILPAGTAARKSKLHGFQWLPINKRAGGERQLYIFYTFRGRLHECTVGDTEALWMPQKKHNIQIHNGPSTPRPKNPRGANGGDQTHMTMHHFHRHSSSWTAIVTVSMMAACGMAMFARMKSM